MKKNETRRDFLKQSATLALGTIAATSLSNIALAGSTVVPPNYFLPDGDKFTLSVLPYNYDALEPHIDKLTMEIHHGKHHQAYVTNLNKALETVDSSVLGGTYTFESIFEKVEKLPAAVRNNAGGHYNHSLFWILMKPNGGGQPKGKLATAINASFGSFDEFKKKFTESAMTRFGSGWAWLVYNNGKLAITSTPNQDNPLMNLSTIETKGKPVLALDVWEHAYYLKNQNKRADYITSWWNVVNWDTAESLFTAASK
ncbi:MAG: Fe-Mn family superoxide dismutase [Bacteroidia bacterium]|jgi:Fe-Mn family superoxide dismutase